jgi:subtilisin family serine protease
MKRVITTWILILAPALAWADTQRYVVALRAGARMDRVGTLLRAIDTTPRDRGVAAFEHLDSFAADLSEAEARRLGDSRNVRYVEPVAERHILGTTPGRTAPDTLRNFDGQTIPAGVDLLRAREVWGVTRGESINVVVIDTGVDYRHPDLAGAWAGGFNALTQSNDPMDDHNHGTHVAGTIAAADNDLGVVGVAPGVRLWGVKALKEDGTGTTEQMVSAINWVIGQKRSLGGNWIINLSIGSQIANLAEGEAIARAIDEGILVVAASGNDSTEMTAVPVSYPGAYPGVLAMGAVDDRLQHASFSNQGTSLGAVAPGVDVLSSVRLGAGILSGVAADIGAFDGTPLDGSPKGTFTGKAVYCGIGRPQDFPAAVSGNIAVIRRGGEMTFADKARSARMAGAIAVVIVDYAESTTHQFTLINWADPDAHTFDWPVSLALRNEDGERLIAAWNATITVTNLTDDYTVKSGTSMSSPHGAAVAALVWSVAPAARAADVVNAMKVKATDLGPPGFDVVYGHGILNAAESAAMMNPAAFGRPPSGRRVLRRGTR